MMRNRQLFKKTLWLAALSLGLIPLCGTSEKSVESASMQVTNPANNHTTPSVSPQKAVVQFEKNITKPVNNVPLSNHPVITIDDFNYHQNNSRESALLLENIANYLANGGKVQILQTHQPTSLSELLGTNKSTKSDK